MDPVDLEEDVPTSIGGNTGPLKNPGFNALACSIDPSADLELPGI